LGHIVSKDGVKVDSKKIATRKDWTSPNTLKSLRGFLHIIGYYRNFIKYYGKIVAPLIPLLKKNAFSWNQVTDQDFQDLKDVMYTTLVLSLPNFTNSFVLECDALGKLISAVLM
jgi:hypothetical protein